MKIFNYGSINIDHVYRVPHLVQPGETLASQSYQKLLGGKGANQSIALARAGAAVIHIGRYHVTDSEILRPMKQAGVNMECLETVDMPSGHAIIQVDNAAENAIVLYSGANHGVTADELTSLLDKAKQGDWLLLQNECSCTAEMIDVAVSKGLEVAFNPAPMDDSIKALPLDKLSLLFVNQVEVLQLLGADTQSGLDADWLAAELQQQLPQTKVVVTLGASGARYFYQGESVFVAAEKVEAVDTTGAGDTFIGYYLQGMLDGLSVTDCLQRASRASALCVQKAGASVSIPLSAELG
uniref:Ribokinase n=1 Tax=uncultured Thiotrichaceae bacterium TaxID=298394 RepID=A0A6S6TY01_9GAMM|nr:MAG: Ribokinase (EC [uncultured Thiotrichaceae bacterium]